MYSCVAAMQVCYGKYFEPSAVYGYCAAEVLGVIIIIIIIITTIIIHNCRG